jgi:hypothetical protein
MVQPQKLLVTHLAENYARCGYNFVPLVTNELSLICGIDILFLRPGNPGEIITSGDIDNRLKVLFDALRMPTNSIELGKSLTPLDDKKPFFVLLEDDKLISHVSVETDTLLQFVTPKQDANEVRLIISVNLRPFDIGWDNISFT